jgi:hypothetical protein
VNRKIDKLSLRRFLQNRIDTRLCDVLCVINFVGKGKKTERIRTATSGSMRLLSDHFLEGNKIPKRKHIIHVLRTSTKVKLKLLNTLHSSNIIPSGHGNDIKLFENCCLSDSHNFYPHFILIFFLTFSFSSFSMFFNEFRIFFFFESFHSFREYVEWN